ncbi:MAG: glycosyltransferase family 4 protein [Pseudomonadota bacterium]
MRVLQVIPELQTGGAEQTAVDIARALVAAGHNAVVASQGGRMVDELPGEAKHVKLPVASKNPLIMLSNVERLTALCRREKIDIIHARSRAPAWSALLVARRLKIPFVTTYHGAYKASNGLKLWYNSVMARSDAVIANSLFTAKRIVEQFPFAESSIRIVPRGTDFSQYDGAAKQYDWDLPDGTRVVLLIARLTRWKGQEVAIKALKDLPENVHLVLAGEDQGRTEYRQSLISLAETLGLSARVHLIGHAEPPRAFAGADVAIVPSTEPEAFGRAAVEAQAAKVPVIVSNLGAVPETVLVPPHVEENERTGWHIPARDPQALRDAITKVLDLEQTELDDHLIRAQAHVQRHFSVESMGDQTLTIYEALLR